MNIQNTHPDIEHPAHAAWRAQDFAASQAEALRSIAAQYDGLVDDAAALAKHAVTEIISLNTESQDFELINIRQLLGSDMPRNASDIPVFEHYYELTGDNSRSGERIVWFGHTGLAAFKRIGCAQKIATELGGNKLWGDSSNMQRLYDFELDALQQTIQVDPHTFIHKIDPFDSDAYHPVTLRPVYPDKQNKQPSPHYVVMRAREAIADVHPTGESKVEIFRATHWLVALRLVESGIKDKLLGGIQLSHEAEQSGESAYAPPYGEELFTAAYAMSDGPTAYVPLISRSLALMRRPELQY